MSKKEENLGENTPECTSETETMETHEILRQSFKVPMSKALAKCKKKRVYTTKIYKCDVCGKQTEDKSVHLNHIQIHSDVKPYQCTQCSNNFKTKKYLARHVKRVHMDSKKLECDQCGKKYMFNTQLKAHMMIHTGEKPLKCKVCDKGFRVHYSLKTHMLIHSDEKPFSCSFCAYSCRDSSTLRKHQHRHMDLDKAYQCRACLVLLRSKIQLKLHIAERHLGLDVRVYKCDLCGKGYKIKSVLAKHIQTIHGREPAPPAEPPDDDDDDDFKPKKKKRVRKFRAQCGVCARVFDRPARYSRHVARHRATTSAKCQHCGMCFLDASYLALHLRRAHGEVATTFECAACAHVCLSRAEMRAHLRSAHGGEAGEGGGADGAREAGGDCGDCGRRFRSATHLARHRAARHAAPSGPPELVVEVKQEPLETEDAFAQLDLFEVEKQDIDDHVRVAALDAARAQIAQQLVCLRRVPERVFDEHFIDTVNKREIDVSVRKDLNERIQKSMRASTDNLVNQIQSQQLSEQASSAVPEETVRSKPKKKHKAPQKEKNTLKEKKKKKRKMEPQLGGESEAGGGVEVAEAGGEVADGGEVEGDAHGRRTFKKIKLKIDLKQCNVCLKVFKSKPELLEHCREHFDVCTERTLKKCPRCEFVTSGDLRRHLRLMHRLDVPMAHVLEETKDADGAARYSYRLASADVPSIEVVPSVARLHQLAGVRPTTLVRRGADWTVRPTFRDDDLIAAGVVAADSHVDKLKKLHRLSKRRKGEPMLFPCDSCAKICRNASGLVLHRRTHDPNAKPFKPKIWKHKLNPQQLADVSRREPQERTVDTHRPRPIVNRHRCDPKLRDFYMNNIRGGDIEFWQFLKIFNKIARDNVNDFSELEQKEEFAMHRVLSPRDPPKPVVPAPEVTQPTTAPEPKPKFTRIVRLSRQEHLRRKALKEKMREKIKAESDLTAQLLEC